MDFHGMKRKKLQVLCKKHGIPANLKNVEMANRLASLFHEDQTTPVRSYKAMSDILSTCSVVESQQDGVSVDDESLVREKTDETLVNTESITSEEEEEMEISKVGCMSVDHCVSNTESALGMPTETELLSANRHGDLSEYNTHGSSSAVEQAEIHKVGRLSAEEQEESHDVVFTTPEQVLLLGDSVVDEVTDDGEQRSEPVSHLHVLAGTDGEENMTVELLRCESGTITIPENRGGSKVMDQLHEEESVVFTGLQESKEFLGEGEVKDPVQLYENVGLSSEMPNALPLAVLELAKLEWLGVNNTGKSSSLCTELLHDDSGHKKAIRTAEKVVAEFPKESELEEAAKSEENKALVLQVDCDNIIGANKNAKCHDMSDLVTATEPNTAGKQGEEMEFKDESAFFTRFETCLLLGESADDLLGNYKSGSSPHDSSAKVILKDDSMVRGSHEPALDLGENTTMDAERKSSFSSYVLAEACSLAPEESSPFTYIHDQINDEFEELAITGELMEIKATTQRDDKEILMLDSSCVSSVSEKEDGHLGL